MDDKTIEQQLFGIEGGATNAYTADYVGISNEPMARWKTALDADDIAMVERLTAPTARKLGYDIDRKRGLLTAFDDLNQIAGALPRMKAQVKTLISEMYETQVKSPT